MRHWQEKAACRNVPTNLFFPPEEAETPNPVALALCDRCPVFDYCDAYAEEIGNAYGVFAGVLYRDGVVVAAP